MPVYYLTVEVMIAVTFRVRTVELHTVAATFRSSTSYSRAAPLELQDLVPGIAPRSALKWERNITLPHAGGIFRQFQPDRNNSQHISVCFNCKTQPGTLQITTMSSNHVSIAIIGPSYNHELNWIVN